MPRPRPTVPKLYIRKGIYHVVWWDNGKRRRLSTGAHDVKVAIAFLRDFAEKAKTPGFSTAVPTRRVGLGTFIYVIASDIGSVKIGISVDPNARVSALQNGHPYKLRLIRAWLPTGVTALKVEKRIHQELSRKRALGEWFDVDPLDACLAIEGVLNGFLSAEKLAA